MSAGLNGLPEDGVAAAARVTRRLAPLTYQVNVRWGYRLGMRLRSRYWPLGSAATPAPSGCAATMGENDV